MSFNETYEKELAFQADRRRATVEFIKIISVSKVNRKYTIYD